MQCGLRFVVPHIITLDVAHYKSTQHLSSYPFTQLCSTIHLIIFIHDNVVDSHDFCELWLAKTECQNIGCVCQMYWRSATLLQIANASVNRLDLEVEKIVLNKVVNKLMLRILSRDVFLQCYWKSFKVWQMRWWVCVVATSLWPAIANWQIMNILKDLYIYIKNISWRKC